MAREPAMDLTKKEIPKVAHLVRNLRRTDRNGNYMVHFSELTVGSALLHKMQKAGWIDQSGWYLSGRGCFVLSNKGRREARAANRPCVGPGAPRQVSRRWGNGRGD